MSDAQNERTRGANRRRGRHGQRGKSDPSPVARDEQGGAATPQRPWEPVSGEMAAAPQADAADFVRPDEADAPTDRYDVYCVHHMALLTEHEPFAVRTNMTTLRHLAVDRFGEATLYCDCLHNGSHEWPPSLQRLETAIELDQFRTDSTSEA